MSDEAYADMVACEDGFQGVLVGRNRHVDGTTMLHARPAGGYLSLNLIWQPHDDTKPEVVGSGAWRAGKDAGECAEVTGLWIVTGHIPGRVRLTERHRG